MPATGTVFGRPIGVNQGIQFPIARATPTCGIRREHSALAMRQDSSSSRDLMIERTGPKTSVWAIAMSLVKQVNTVGSINQPSPHSGRKAGLRPMTQVASPAVAISMQLRIRRNCGGVVTGPTCVAGLSGSPIRAFPPTLEVCGVE